MGGCARPGSGRIRPGLTMIELLVAMTLLGVMGALLMPRLVPQQSGYVGIGALLEKPRRESAYAWIARPFPGSPAEQAGLRYGDLIISIDGVDMLNESLDTLGERCMGGPVGSPVQLTILRDGQPEMKTLYREWINLSAAEGERYGASSARSHCPFGL
jgi:prepilin-type N-terminal cleavage/methylation domain-containing protein